MRIDNKQISAREWGALAVFVTGCLVVGMLGGFVTSTSVDSWYPDLNKPSWNPPAWVFGPVWTLLYIMMGVSVWLVWRRREFHDTRPAMVLFAVQLLLNTAWSTIFFGLREPGYAVIDIVLLWLAIVATTGAFGRISKSAAWLLVPYLAWVSFAALLNFTIWRLNP